MDSSSPTTLVRHCIRCALPASFPSAQIDEHGVCSYCRHHGDARSSEGRRLKLRERLDSLIAEHRDGGSYDLLMAFSGGKDSSYTLDLLRRRYGIQILAVTMDNGFLPDTTRDNIRRLVDELGVDHIFLRPRSDRLRTLFAEAARRDLFSPSTLGRASSICTACISVVKFSCLRLAIEKGIPFVGYGWTPGQAPLSSAILRPTPAMLSRMQEVLRGPIEAVVGDESKHWFLEDEHLDVHRGIPWLISPLALFDYDEDQIVDALLRLGWRRPSGVDINSTNCQLNALANHLHRQRHGFHPYAFELSGLVREGRMSREEALERQREEDPPETIAHASQCLGLSLEEIEP